MGQVLSFASRKANRFNVENRAHRVLEKEKPTPAPKYESNIRDFERVAEGFFYFNFIKYILYLRLYDTLQRIHNFWKNSTKRIQTLTTD